MQLGGRTALVTGAAQGIGRVTALALAAAGADVAAADVKPAVEETAALVQERGRRAAAAVLDVADPEQVRAGVRAVTEALGPIDILVSNAGLVANIAPVAEMAPAAWARELAVNLGGAFHAIQAVLGPMVERRWGRIIVVSSVAARGGLHRQAAYAASKAGLLGLVRTVTLEHARHGITCNAVLPGLIETETVRAMPPEILDTVRAATPARRLGAMEEVATLIAFLASDQAGFINGTDIDVDGGWHLGTVSLASRAEARAAGRTEP